MYNLREWKCPLLCALQQVWRRRTSTKGLPKLANAEEMGDSSACSTPVTPVVYCGCGSDGDLRSCSSCMCAKYCSVDCQRRSWSQHKTLCGSIVELERMEKEKEYRNKSVHQNQVNSRIHLKMVKLVGNKPKVQCYLNGKQTEMLMDTGSMVSLGDEEWADENFPGAEILPVTDFLDGEQLKLCAANSTEIKFKGVMLVTFGLEEGKDKFVVPVLVSSQPLTEPILGVNVIEHLVLEGDAGDHKLLQSCLQSRSKRSVDINSLVALIEEKARSPDFLAEVHAREVVTVPAGHRRQIKCVVKERCEGEEQTVYFQPKLSVNDEDLEFLETVTTLKRGRTNHVYVEVLNKSGVEKVLSKGSVMGSIHSVSAVVPMVKSRWSKKEVEGVVGTVNASAVSPSTDEDAGDDWVPPADLSHLDEEQREMVMKVLVEEKEVFSCSEHDIGDIKNFHMQITLADETPVKEPYRRTHGICIRKCAII